MAEYETDVFGRTTESYRADWRWDDFQKCRSWKGENPLIFTARMWDAWQKAHPYGIDTFAGITVLASRLPPGWNDWAIEVSREFFRRETPFGPLIGDMAGFVKKIMTVMVVHEDGPPPLSSVPPPTVPLQIYLWDSEPSGFELGGPSQPRGTKRARADEELDLGPLEPKEEGEATPEDVWSPYEWPPEGGYDEEDSPHEDDEYSPHEDSVEGDLYGATDEGRVDVTPPVSPEPAVGPLSPYYPAGGSYFFMDYPGGNGYFLYPALSPLAPPEPVAPAEPMSRVDTFGIWHDRWKMTDRSI